MKKQPTLKTERLTLRPFKQADAARVRHLAGDERIADMVTTIPHPYPEGLAERWIAGHQVKWASAELATFAIVTKEGSKLIGCISAMNMDGTEAEIGYWLGVDYWGSGFATEACRILVDFCLNRLGIERVHARHLSRNPASGRVLAKSGLSHVGSGVSKCGYRGSTEQVEYYELINPGRSEGEDSILNKPGGFPA